MLTWWAFGLAASAHAATYTVISADDVDHGGDCSVAHCTLRDAITAANASAGADTIIFQIPGGGPQVIALTTDLPAITDAVTIDGYTQPGASANTQTVGGLDAVVRIQLQPALAGPSFGLSVQANNVTISGLAIGGFATAAIGITSPGTSGIVVTGNFLGTAADGVTALGNGRGISCADCTGLTIGGSVAVARNLIAGNTGPGIDVTRLSATPMILTIRGNLIGTDKTAAAGLGNLTGILLTTTAAVANAGDRINIGGIGGPTSSEEANVIAGNGGNGIQIIRTAGDDAANGQLQVWNNFIGTADREGTIALGNVNAGVVFSGKVKATLLLNTIAYNAAGGVAIAGPTTSSGLGISVSTNAIFGNNGLGIDLGADGRTANDADDSDDGANGLLNFPVIATAGIDPGSGVMTVVGSIQATPTHRYRVDLYDNGPTVRPTGYDARQLVFGTSLMTDTNGQGTFTISVPPGVGAAIGDYIVALLQDDSGKTLTSEISDAVAVTIAPPSITGHVTREGSTALQNVIVQLTGTETHSAVTDAAGNYTFANLTIGGDYTVSVSALGYVFVPDTRSYTNVQSTQAANFTATTVPATFIVNVTHDAGDGVCTLSECTLREAISAANAHPGPDVIAFAIPGPGPHALAVDSALPSVDSDVVIDGYTESGAFPNANLNGGLNGVLKIALQRGSAYTSHNAVGLVLFGDRITVKGLVIAGFPTGIQLGGGVHPQQDVVIAGNYFGTTPDGLTAVPNSDAGIASFGPATLTLGGSTAAARNLIAGHTIVGIFLMAGRLGNAVNYTVRGNLIGTDATGQAAIPNQQGFSYGADTDSDADILHLGGDGAGDRNVISGNVDAAALSRGFNSDSDAGDQQVVGNWIGVAADGVTPLGNTNNALLFGGAVRYLVARNLIANNAGNGIVLSTTPTASGHGVELTENRIFANGVLPIDLGGDQRTINDADDSDTGSNNLQNFPVLTSMAETVSGTTLTGTLTSLPNRTYRIELFTTDDLVSAALNARAFVGSFTVTTDGNGMAAFSHVFTAAFTANQVFVTTATDVEAMMTSELSYGVTLVPLERADVTVNVMLDGQPQDGVDIAVTGDRQVTQPTVNGTRVFNLPLGGSYLLTPSLSGYVFTPESVPVTNLAAAQTITFTARQATFTRMLPEGATGSFWKTSIALLNANSVPTTATLSFLLPDGSQKTLQVPLTGPGHAVIDPATVDGLSSASFSTLVSATEPLAVSRTTRWGEHQELGAHAEQAIDQPRTSWYFAEGSTGCFQLFYLLVNPNATPAEVDITYTRRAPDTPLVQHYSLAPFARTTIQVNAEEGLSAAEISAAIIVANGQPIVAERAMYSSCFGTVFRGGHDAVASPAPATEWFFAEGATGSFFNLYLLLANFDTTDAAVDVEYLLDDGTTETHAHVVPAQSRLTIDVATESARLASANVSAIVRSTNTVPVVAERAQWWPKGNWTDGHVSAGATEPGIEWQAAGAEVGGDQDTQTFLLIANTAVTVATVQVRLVYNDGTSESLPQPLTLTPHSRATLSLGEAFAHTHNHTVGVVIDSLGDTPAPIVVELSSYSNTPSPDGGWQLWGAGTNLVATRVR